MKRFLQISCLLLLNSAQIAFAAPPASTQPLFVINFHWSAADDGILLEKTWEGKPADFMFDTGADACCVDSAFFSPLRPTNQDLDAETGGGSKTFQTFDPPDLSFGPLHLRDAGSVVGTDLSGLREQLDRPVVGVLGNNVCQKLVVQIDFDTGQLRFFNPDDLPHPEWGSVIPLESAQRPDGFHYPTPFIRLNIGGFEDLFVLDTGETGNASGMMPSEGFDYILSKNKFPVTHSPIVTAAGTTDSRYIRIPSFTLADQHYQNVLFGEVKTWSGILGLRFLSRHLVTIDFPHSRLFLKPGKDFDRPDPYGMSGIAVRRSTGKTIATIIPNTPADQAGMHTGDILLEINDKPADSYSLYELRTLLRSKEGQQINIKFLHDNKPQSASFKLRKEI